MNNRYRMGLAASAMAAAALSFAPTIDGSIAGDGYALNALQKTQTGFGDNFSEMNGLYTRFEGGNLYVAITGNLEANFNKLNIFFDTKVGGQTVINSGSNPTNDNWANKYNGMSFDNAFAADYMLIFRHGNGGTQFDVDYGIVGGAAGDGALIMTFDNTATNGQVNTNVGGKNVIMDVRLDNSNVAGILGGDQAANQANAAAVMTGLEFCINLDALDIAIGNTFKISAHINGSNHDYLSNQSFGSFEPPQGNLGGDGAGNFFGDLSRIDFNQFAGDQFVEVNAVPEPATLAVLGLGAAALIRRRKK